MAAVDIGSNSMRLLLCTGVGEGGPEGERFTTIIGLKRGAAPDGTLADDALGRLDDLLADYGRKLAGFGAQHVLAVATSATRDAPNRGRVESIVRDRLGAVLTVVGGDEEAGLAFAGARLASPDGGPCLVVDIGGGSTEFVHGGASGPDGSVSMQVGSVRQTDAFLHSDPPSPGEVAALRASVRPILDAGAERFPGEVPVIGVAGTITSLSAIELGGYDMDRNHGNRLTLAAIDELTDRLAEMTLEQRRTVPGLHPDRAPAIVAGAAICCEAMRALGVTELTVSERDLLDGIAMRAIAEVQGS